MTEHTGEEARLDAAIEASLAETVGYFIPSRYPYTYAYDFFRSHAENFGADSVMSRAQTASAVRRYAESLGLDRERVIERLADAYMREWRIPDPRFRPGETDG